jgi:hypothetical protein
MSGLARLRAPKKKGISGVFARPKTPPMQYHARLTISNRLVACADGERREHSFRRQVGIGILPLHCCQLGIMAFSDRHGPGRKER